MLLLVSNKWRKLIWSRCFFLDSCWKRGGNRKFWKFYSLNSPALHWQGMCRMHIRQDWASTSFRGSHWGSRLQCGRYPHPVHAVCTVIVIIQENGGGKKHYMSIFNAVPVLRSSGREPCGNAVHWKQLHRRFLCVKAAQAKGEKEKWKWLGWHWWPFFWSLTT